MATSVLKNPWILFALKYGNHAFVIDNLGFSGSISLVSSTSNVNISNRFNSESVILYKIEASSYVEVNAILES